MITALNFSVQGLSKKYLTLSPPTKNNALPTKWFWRIVNHNYCLHIKNFKLIVGIISFLSIQCSCIVYDRPFFAHKPNDRKHQPKILYQVLPKAR